MIYADCSKQSQNPWGSRKTALGRPLKDVFFLLSAALDGQADSAQQILHWVEDAS